MRLVYSGHALARMTERHISPGIVRAIMETGQALAEYPDDRPLPSKLVLGWDGSRPIHVVSARDEAEQIEYIVTVYEPDPQRWFEGFTRRKS